MSRLSFNLVFMCLMGLAALAAFALPLRVSEGVRATTATLLIPIARPVRGLGDWASARTRTDPLDPESPTEPRSVKTLAEENATLRMLNENLAAQLDELIRLNTDRAQLGDIRRLCDPAEVIGQDGGTRESITISTRGLPPGIGQAAVLCPRGLVGQVAQTPGVGSARVRLLTDRGMKVVCRFERIESRGSAVARARVNPGMNWVIEGAGPGLLRVNGIKEPAAGAIHPGDVALLDDPRWPQVLQGMRVARVATAEPSADPGFVNVTLEPMADLMNLREVAVLIRGAEN